MADEELRQLARRFQASGDPSDEVAWVLALLRSGALPLERVELAALVGHEAACRVLDELDPSSDAPALLDVRRGARVPDERWLLRELWTRSREGTVRFAGAVAWNRLGARQGGAAEELRAAIASAEAWVLCPCAEHAERSAGHARSVWGRLSAGTWHDGGPALLGAAFAAALTAEAAGSQGGEPRYLFGLLSHEVEGDRARACAEVARWALGREDPVRARAPGSPGP